jgi:hypothetical protein
MLMDILGFSFSRSEEHLFHSFGMNNKNLIRGDRIKLNSDRFLLMNNVS